MIGVWAFVHILEEVSILIKDYLEEVVDGDTRFTIFGGPAVIRSSLADKLKDLIPSYPDALEISVDAGLFLVNFNHTPVA